MPRKTKTIEKPETGTGSTKPPTDLRTGATAAEAPVTPMMAQYAEIKAANPDSLLFYRMGDFYELFFEDAVAAAQALGITLTKRGKHLGEDIPMAGVPVHAADDYLQRLIRLGFRVAVCEQTEDPSEAKKRGAKSVVRRDVIRLVTPGTLTEDNLLDARANNFLSALFRSGEQAAADAPSSGQGVSCALASLDISTGEFQTWTGTQGDVSGELARLSPSEVLVADTTFDDPVFQAILNTNAAAKTPVPRAHFDSRSGERDLKQWLGVSELGGFGTFAREELAAVGALLKYIDLTQIGQRPVIRPPKRITGGAIMMIDAATRSNLELIRTSSGEKRGSLLDAMDRTVTGPGARELSNRVASPIADVTQIADRLDAVGYLLDAPSLRHDMRAILREVPDLARALSRLALNRGGPRDLGAIRDGLGAARGLAGILMAAGETLGLPRAVARCVEDLRGETEVSEKNLEAELAGALADELPALRRDGGYIRDGYSADLDENRALRDNSRKVLADLQARYQDLTGIRTLRVRHNNVLGYFVEVSAANAAALSGGGAVDIFVHRQSLANAVRFVTSELTEIEGRITSAGERALALEGDIFSALVTQVLGETGRIGAMAAALAELDVHTGLAELAEEQRLVRPALDASTAFAIRGGRHLVVEQALSKSRAGPFVENDCVLGYPQDAGTHGGPPPTPTIDFEQPGRMPGAGFDEDDAARIWLITGPNMAGKSTFLRQNALIAIMAQMGSYVPARTAHIGIVDRLFSRVGASDDLARGRSTFMVEMVETAAILNQATERSLVILDEIGRGTATYDGLSIAWATVEYLHEASRCRALFATHYHELTALASKLPEVGNATIEVREWHDDIVFLYKVIPGAADRSYGIQVARLAGLPPAVIARAGEILRLLEENDTRRTPEQLADDLPLFAATRPRSTLPKAHADVRTGNGAAGSEDTQALTTLRQAIADIHPDEMSPRQALDALYRLRELARHEAG